MSHARMRREPGGIPADSTPFVGRVAELAQLTAMLTAARLVTVTGTGGVGKTRLALRAAAETAPRFDDGVCLAELSGLRDPDLLPHAIAERLGLAERDSRTATDDILSYLRDRKMLLVLDTCEHLLDACAELTEVLLQQTDSITVLSTSRQPLDVAGENICPLAPLRVPADDAKPSPGDAIDLFTRLARAADPGFAVTPQNRDEVIRLCRRLAGIPLALELAAGLLRTLPLSELAARTADAARTARAGAAGMPAPHMSPLDMPALTNAIQRSYTLCTPAEQALWQRLSVFAGSFTLPSAEQVCAGRHLPRDAVVETVIALVDKSVLVREEPASTPAAPVTPGTPNNPSTPNIPNAPSTLATPHAPDHPGGEPARFRLLDPIREFGAMKLAESGTADAVTARFIAAYLEAARYFRDHLTDDDQLPRFRELRRDHANLQAALGYALETKHGAFGENLPACRLNDGAELATALFGYWQAAGLQAEGLMWLDKVLEHFPRPSPQRAAALGIRCYLAAMGGLAPEAVGNGEEAVAVATDIGDQQAGARAHMFLCHALTIARRYDDAIREGKEASRQLTVLGDHVGRVILASHLAHAYQLAGDLPQADAWYQRGVALLGESRERWMSGWLHLIGGFTMFQLPGREADCVAVWRKSLRAKCDLGDVVGIGFGLAAFTMLAAFAGQGERAAWLFGAARPLWDRAGAVLSNNPPLVELHDQVFEQVRGELGTRRFDTIYAQGRRSSVRQATELALSDSCKIPAAVPASPRGGTLTKREEEVARLAVDGLSNREIAARMTISKRTVDAHVEHIYAKLGLSSRIELAMWYQDRE